MRTCPLPRRAQVPQNLVSDPFRVRTCPLPRRAHVPHLNDGVIFFEAITEPSAVAPDAKGSSILLGIANCVANVDCSIRRYRARFCKRL